MVMMNNLSVVSSPLSVARLLNLGVENKAQLNRVNN